MGKVTVKSWEELQSDFDDMSLMSCVPVGLKRVPSNYIFDEDKSVKWNKEQVAINNENYQKEVARLNTEKNKRRDSILEDIYKAIQYEVGHNITRKQAQAVWNYAYEQSYSFRFNSILNCLYVIMELVEVLLGGDE